MMCSHCSTAFHPQVETFELDPNRERNTRWRCEVMVCPQCDTPLASFKKFAIWHDEEYGQSYSFLHSFSVNPIVPAEAQVSEHVPDALARDYKEAQAVLPHSAKASAALSRRVLQALLQEQGYAGGNLARQVDAVLSETDPSKVLPTSIKASVDAIRNFGNFSAHPTTDSISSQIIDVEPEEAEWCLEIVESLFDHYYVRPAADAKKREDLNAKLQRARKPPAKT